jgi:hypothetical protein
LKANGSPLLIVSTSDNGKFLLNSGKSRERPKTVKLISPQMSGLEFNVNFAPRNKRLSSPIYSEDENQVYEMASKV